ncbi:hypothetical protein BDF19DRAFT_453758 [Syncephalis fuscata]|nr:hypothetical protein BDF19DRAFT_453758 [Syncephalis fuscata]
MYIQFLSALFVWFLVQENTAFATISITNTKDKKEVYTTADYFLSTQSDYHYNGVGITWGFQSSSVENSCTVQSVNITDNYIRSMATIASVHPDFAIMMKMKDFHQAGCKAKNQVNNAIADLSQQMIDAGFPEIRLLILVNDYTSLPLWGFGYILLNRLDLYDGLLELSSMRTTVVNINNTLLDDTWNYSSGNFYYFASHSPSSWNSVFLSSGFLVYKWVCFSVLLAVLLYICARTGMLAKLKMLRRDLLLVSFVITVVYCISLLIHFAIRIELFKHYSATYSFLARIPVNIILWHWSSVGKQLFPRKAVIAFRMLILFDAAMGTALYLYIISIPYSNPYKLNISLFGFHEIFIWIESFMPVVTILVFYGFTIWFSLSAYRLQKHIKGRKRFIKLAVFTAVSTFTNTIILLCILLALLFSYPTATQMLIVDHIYDIAYLIRAFVLLSVWGVRWPKEKQSMDRIAFDGTTTVGCEVKAIGSDAQLSTV